MATERHLHSSLAECPTPTPAPATEGSLAAHYAAHLLQSLPLARQHGAPLSLENTQADIDAARDWAASGLMWLTGCPGEPPARAAHAVASCARGALQAFSRLCAPGAALPDNGATLLVERAALLGLARRERRSANGSCHLLRSADGWLALNLARADDRALLPAWVQAADVEDDLGQLQAMVALRKTSDLLERGHLLGLPVAAPGGEDSAHWFKRSFRGTPRAPRTGVPPLVVDLSALWAGPLCASLLHSAGARVIRVESTTRPDPTRQAAPAFFDLLNAGKEQVALDFGSERALAQLRQLLAVADIVIEGSRPRALRQLGILAEDVVAVRPGVVWLSLTGYGRAEPFANRVAFGDDAAFAAGLCAVEPRTSAPVFCGDALCDPLLGLHAALAALAFWQSGEAALLDFNLHDVGAHCRGFHCSANPGAVVWQREGWMLEVGGQRFPVQRPRGRTPGTRAAPSGWHTEQVIREFCSAC